MRRYLLLLTLLGMLVLPRSAQHVPRGAVHRASSLRRHAEGRAWAAFSCSLWLPERFTGLTVASGRLIVSQQYIRKPKVAPQARREGHALAQGQAHRAPATRSLDLTPATFPRPSPTIRANDRPVLRSEPDRSAYRHVVLLCCRHGRHATQRNALPDRLCARSNRRALAAARSTSAALVHPVALARSKLPVYGLYDVIVSYASSSASVAPSTARWRAAAHPQPGRRPSPTTTTLIGGPVSQGTLPPPHDQIVISTSISLYLATTDPTPTYDITVTDTTTGTSATGTLNNPGRTCACSSVDRPRLRPLAGVASRRCPLAMPTRSRLW